MRRPGPHRARSQRCSPAAGLETPRREAVPWVPQPPPPPRPRPARARRPTCARRPSLVGTGGLVGRSASAMHRRGAVLALRKAHGQAPARAAADRDRATRCRTTGLPASWLRSVAGGRQASLPARAVQLVLPAEDAEPRARRCPAGTAASPSRCTRPRAASWRRLRRRSRWRRSSRAAAPWRPGRNGSPRASSRRRCAAEPGQRAALPRSSSRTARSRPSRSRRARSSARRSSAAASRGSIS